MTQRHLSAFLLKINQAVIELNKGKYKIGLKDRNQSDVSEELRRAINDCLSESSSTFRLEDVSKHLDIGVDEEEEDEDCRRGREAAQQMMSLLVKKDLREIKESFLPHQGKLWHQWCQKNKELHRHRADETEMNISKKTLRIKKIRGQQNESDISEFMKLFIKEMNSDAGNEKIFSLNGSESSWMIIQQLTFMFYISIMKCCQHTYKQKIIMIMNLNNSKLNKLNLREYLRIFKLQPLVWSTSCGRSVRSMNHVHLWRRTRKTCRFTSLLSRVLQQR